jgi:hypothetical protein
MSRFVTAAQGIVTMLGVEAANVREVDDRPRDVPLAARRVERRSRAARHDADGSDEDGQDSDNMNHEGAPAQHDACRHSWSATAVRD